MCGCNGMGLGRLCVRLCWARAADIYDRTRARHGVMLCVLLDLKLPLARTRFAVAQIAKPSGSGGNSSRMNVTLLFRSKCARMSTQAPASSMQWPRIAMDRCASVRVYGLCVCVVRIDFTLNSCNAICLCECVRGFVRVAACVLR